MATPGVADTELSQLRRSLRDLAALAALPVVWTTGNTQRVLGSLAEAVLGMLRLDFAYIRLTRSDGTPELEVGRVAHSPSVGPDARALGALLEAWLDADGGTELPVLPGCGPGLRGLIVPFGLDGQQGLIAAGNTRRTFPTDSDRLLLRVAANQAAVMLARQRSEEERERLLRAVETERNRLADVFQHAPSFLCLLRGPDHVLDRANERYLQLVGSRDVIGKTIREALPEVVDQGFLELLDRVYQTGEPYFGYDQAVELSRGQGQPPQQFYVDFVYQPMRDEDGHVTGILVQGVDLTQRKRAEAELRAKDARLQLLMNNIQDFAVVIIDRSGRVVEWAAGAERITGHAAGEVLGQKADFLYTEEDRKRGQLQQELTTARQLGKSEGRRWYMRKDGRAFFADELTTPLYDEMGQLRGFGKIFRDVTSEWQARQELARVTDDSNRRKRLYETILDNTPDLAYVFDRNHRFTYANQMLLRMWGRSWQEAIGKSCLELGYEPWLAELHDREIDQVIATRKPVRGEAPFTGTFGRRIHDYIFVPILGPGGEVEGVAGTTRDITERKAAEEDLARLLEAEKRRAGILLRVAQASTAINDDLSIESISRTLTEQARGIIGAHQAATTIAAGPDGSRAITTVSFSDKYAAHSPCDLEAGQGMYAEVCRTGTPVRLTQEQLEHHPLWGCFADAATQQTRMRGLLAAQLVGRGGTNLGVVQLSDKYDGEFSEEDESILVQLAAIAAAGIENARLYDALKEQDRRKNEFLAILAHELRNPLAPVRSGLDILRSLASQDQTALKTQQMMARQVSHMARLVDDLLDISRISQGKLALQLNTVPLRTVFETALETARPLIEAAGHALEVRPPPPSVLVHADHTRLAQVLANLLNNAARYTPPGGRISCCAEERDGQACIEVEDSGIGMAPEMLSRVFELFMQGDRDAGGRQGGLGIGLALAKSLVEMHGGRIEASSAGPGRGSRFTVRLPAATGAPSPDARGPDPETADPAASAMSILVVDDNADAAETFATILGLSGHAVHVAKTGEEALRLAGQILPQVIFLDIGLPDMDGYAVARRLRADTSGGQPCIVALTGWGGEADRQRSRAAGFDHHLTKPVETAAAMRLLREIATTAAERLSATRVG